jgi:hypothetical protein
VQLAAGAVLLQREQAAAFGKSFGKVGKQFGGNFPNAALGLDDAGESDELVVYSTISRV